MGVVVVELYEALQKAGVDEPLARSAAAAVVPANGLEHLATKSDIRHMATKIDFKSAATKADIKDMATKADIKDMLTRADIKDMVTKSDLKFEIAQLRTEIAEVRADLIKWNIGTMVALTALCAAIMRLG